MIRIRRDAGQLASKMRFLSAPWVGLLENDAWLKHSRHANIATTVSYDMRDDNERRNATDRFSL